MTLKVPLSQLQDRVAFAKAVLDHIDDLHAFNKTEGQPRPVTHPMVEGAIKRVQRPNQPDLYVADYTIVDDTPAPVEPPPVYVPTVGEKKIALVNAVRKLENEAKFKILPQGKQRLAMVKMNAAWQVPEDERSAEQREDIASYILVQKAWQALELIGAQAESDIEDLAEDAIDSWQPPTFG